MSHKIQLGDKWYILATSSPADERRRVLKHGDSFAIFDRFGDIQPVGVSVGEEGLYHGDTRFLSHQEFLINGARPMFLNSAIKEGSGLFVIELMNPDMEAEKGGTIAKGLMHIFRAKLLWQGTCYEHIRIVNFGLEEVQATLSMEFAADYADIFEVRGFQRNKKGEMLPPESNPQEICLSYRGLDHVKRKTHILFDPEPDKITSNQAEYKITLPAKGEAHLYVNIYCETEGNALLNKEPSDYMAAFRESTAYIDDHLSGRCLLTTSNELANRWIERSVSDLIMLTSKLPQGDYPYAGVPWYSTTFGRDGILTAHECLWVDPGLAKGVLRFLAANQASELDPSRDAEPGKILHEARKGELAALDEVPFRHYYGTVDATPLFIGLAGAYYERTGDLELIQEIWPNIQRALEWIDRYGDMDGDGFVEYARRSETGLEQQGWKDSHDSVFHQDGTFAKAPIALCEVQGYVYQAKLYAAQLSELLGDFKQAKKLRDAAELLKRNFNEAFWCEEIGTYALALDGHKQQCKVRSSNAGHALWSGIAAPEYAARVAAQLVDEDSFCGWGIRTIAKSESRYNPMSYHNGSVWPHDNALIAAGMARYGFTDKAMKVFCGLFDVSQYVDQHRLPELFSSFEKRSGEGPTLYPVACSPQAWAAGSVYYLLQACLGLSFDPGGMKIRFRHPQLPPFLETVDIKGLALKNACFDLRLQRYPNNVGINIITKQGNAEVVVIA